MLRKEKPFISIGAGGLGRSAKPGRYSELMNDATELGGGGVSMGLVVKPGDALNPSGPRPRVYLTKQASPASDRVLIPIVVHRTAWSRDPGSRHGLEELPMPSRASSARIPGEARRRCSGDNDEHAHFGTVHRS